MATLQDFQNFQRVINEELLTHPIITNNEYCRWFEDADLTIDEVRHFAVQFSVFSNQFIESLSNRRIYQ